MSIISIDGNLLKKMIIGGSNKLSANRALVDSLNVFPVPDGDTGTNMSLTVLAAAREVEKLSTPNVHDVAKAAASGSLRGARGNSGVILSQLFRGFAKGLEGVSLATGDDLANALSKAVETAYKAVMKPTEGTILTVAKALANTAGDAALDTEDIEELIKTVIAAGHETLSRTTQMLSQLRQAGVVDAGGKGLMCIMEGAAEGLFNHDDVVLLSGSQVQQEIVRESGFAGKLFSSGENIRFGYCTEFFINIPQVSEQDEHNLKNYLQSIGDSIVVVSDEDLIKVHIHTNHPGNVLEKALILGSLDNVKIENMRLQHTSMIDFVEHGANVAAEEAKAVGFIAVAIGDGLAELFTSMGVDRVIEGGQTMNPSTDDFVAAAQQINAENIFILPNNKNIILAAQQAADLVTEKNLIVIGSKSIPQGLTAMINYLSDTSVEENIKKMEDAMSYVKTGQVTYAVRDTVFDSKNIEKGDILCMLDGKIVLVSRDLQDGARGLLDILAGNDGEILSVYYGEEVSEEQAKALADYARESYPDYEIELHKGNQPLYYYIMSVE